MSKVERVKQELGEEQIHDEDCYRGHNEYHNRGATYTRCPALDT